MEIAYYVAKAAKALDVPDELWHYWINFDYDPFQEEWCFEGFVIKGPKPMSDVLEWVNRICSWLQCQYPQGPRWPEECCC